jgi:hypothetical protein
MTYKAWIIIEDIEGERDCDTEFSLTGQEHETIGGVLDEIWNILWTTNSPAINLWHLDVPAVHAWAKKEDRDTVDRHSRSSDESIAPS